MEKAALYRHPKAANLLFMAAQALFWAGHCMTFGFMVSYLKQEGYMEAGIGFIISMATILTLVLQPALGYLSDTYVPIKTLSVCCIALSIPLSLVIPKSIAVPLLASVIIIGLGTLLNSVSPIIEVWTIKTSERQREIDFGLSRGTGSIGYALTALIMGTVLQKIGLSYMFMFHALFFFALLIVLFFIRGIPCSNRREQPGQAHSGEKLSFSAVLRILCRSPKYILFLVFQILLNIGFKTISTFYPLILSEHGGNDSALGVALFISAITEAPAMMFSGRLCRKFKPENLILFSCFFYILRYVLYYTATSVLMLQIAQVTQMLSFGLFYPCTMIYLQQLAPERIRGTAVTVTLAISNALSSILGTMAFGVIIQYTSIGLCLILCTVITVIAMCVLTASKFVKNVPMDAHAQCV